MSQQIKPIIYEKEYAEAMAKVLRYRFDVSSHAITAPLWDALSTTLTYYGTYDEESLKHDAVNRAKSKVRSTRGFIYLKGEDKEEVIRKIEESVLKLVEFIIEYSKIYPKQKAWELARTIRRSVVEIYLLVVGEYYEEKRTKKD